MDTEALRLLIDQWVLAVQDDYEFLEVVLNGVVSAYMTEKRRVAKPEELAFETVMHYLGTLSPRRWQRLSVYAWMEWFNTVLKRAKMLGLGRAESIAYCFGVFYFGYALELNPIIPWAGQELLRKDASDEARSFAFALAAQKHLSNIVNYDIPK